MMYLSGCVRPEVWQLVLEGKLGALLTPRTGNKYRGGTWAADNGCFNAGTYVGDDKWLAWLRRMAPHAGECLFATAPDVVGDAAATLERSRPYLQLLRELGYRAAYVGQDGATVDSLPWDEFDVLFIGGSTEWKLSGAARELAAEARRRSKPVHMGRVNSRKRLRIADEFGCSTADGTYLAFGPDKNLPKLMSWLDDVNGIAA